ncbi:MAG TPA: beta-galactosidase [Opitutaceae bacterium]|nr:beta-galactosidase [Opitutaceae bacterium]
MKPDISVITRRPINNGVAVVAFLIMVVFSGTSAAKSSYEIDISEPASPVTRGHLDLGGKSANGGVIEVNNRYIERDERPYIPVVGEFHYSRYPHQYWLESLKKMKAGGVDVVATYVFWNIHERTEDKWDWSGDLDVRKFMETAKEVGLDVILRVGPFDHGEMRNGGLPDWLYGQPLEIRSNDPRYLSYVEKLYTEIGRQIRGLLYKDGGPILGIQLENEYQHSAAPWEMRYAGSPMEFTTAQRDLEVTHGGVSVSETENKHAAYGESHMARLKAMAKKAGLDAPIYTATGWGNAAIVRHGSLPVSAAYAYPFWAPITASPFYLFKDLHRSPDYAPVSYQSEEYPSIAAEMGAGIQPIYKRRPFVPEESIPPLIIRALGSGSNGIGYYMYHGGANPTFDGKFFNEDASGLPKINYDYQSPIGEYGRTKSHFNSLRIIHDFVRAFGDRLAPMQTILPSTNDGITPDDVETFRFAARSDAGRGFVFFVNFQDHKANRDLVGISLRVNDGKRTISIPSKGTMTVPAGSSGILPLNLDVNGAQLRSATVQPLTVLRVKGKDHYLFTTIPGIEPELVFESTSVSQKEKCSISNLEDGAVVIRASGDAAFAFDVGNTRVVVLPYALALTANRVSDEQLVFFSDLLLGDGKGASLLTTNTTADLAFYPKQPLPKVAGANVSASGESDSLLSNYKVRFEERIPRASFHAVGSKRYLLDLEDADLNDLNDIFMTVDYVGDTGMAFVDGKLIDDHFYTGRPWEIGLKRFLPLLKGKQIVFVFQPLQKGATYLQDLPASAVPNFKDDRDSVLLVKGVSLSPEYRAELSW